MFNNNNKDAFRLYKALGTNLCKFIHQLQLNTKTYHETWKDLYKIM